MTQLAPVVCSAPCGAPVFLLWEAWDRVSHVYVGKLECRAGHSWIDMRAEDHPRPHVFRGQGRLPFMEKRSRKMPKNDDDT